ncbi:VOC family protein [Dactylosporangium sp. NPDC005555]|uniref:VOC family protein n=1 Tax=Dactylosporangium sp. NPDC005555 TaxID=3154889 RepID=UPI00339FECFE
MAEREFEIGGINHLALVCSDMRRTVDFYTNVLGLPLIKTVELPSGMGQHFFFDCGGGNALAFFWFPGAPDKVPGVTHPGALPGVGDIASAVASMNHVALQIPVDKFDEYRERLQAKGVEVGHVVFHDDSPSTIARRMHDGVYVGSLYFFDPDGILLEFAAWTRKLTPDDVRHEPAAPVVKTVAKA